MEKKRQLVESRSMGFCQKGCQVGCIIGRGYGEGKILFCEDKDHQSCPHLGTTECTANLWLKGVIQSQQSVDINEVSVQHHRDGRDVLVMITREVMDECPACKSSAAELRQLGLPIKEKIKASSA